MKKLFLSMLAVAFLAQSAWAQTAPVPRSSPRTPVNRQALPDRKPVIPPDSSVQGTAIVTDTDKLRINDIDIRLFGIVPPQLSASYGPQARTVLDNLVTGQNVSCLVRDRDQAGRYLATCRTSANNDLATELLRRGLAVTARGSLANTDLLASYLAAEQAAQGQKLGLWTTSIPAAANIVPVPAKVEAPKAEIPAPAPPPPIVAETKSAKVEKTEPKATENVQAKVPSSAVSASSLAPPAEDAMALPDEGPGFFARYQLLITGFIMLATALSILTVVSRQRRQEKRDEMKAIAAALRGELMAARAVCQARLKTDTNDKDMSWPRIRATLYQAYVGRLGFLGAELARQVASIYGQASDYAAYYNSDEENRSAAPKRQALQTLIQHIEEVLPKLSSIEQTGRLSYSYAHSSSPPAPMQPVITTSVDEKPAAAEVVEHHVASVAPLWHSVRKFARDRFTQQPVHEHDESDYTSLIEEEMAGMSFSDVEDEANMVQMPENVSKMRTGS